MISKRQVRKGTKMCAVVDSDRQDCAFFLSYFSVLSKLYTMSILLLSLEEEKKNNTKFLQKIYQKKMRFCM